MYELPVRLESRRRQKGAQMTQTCRALFWALAGTSFFSALFLSGFICLEGTRQVGVGVDNRNGPKLCQTRHLGLGAFFFPSLF